MKCAKCNQEVPEGSQFCYNCGAMLVPEENTAPALSGRAHKVCPGCKTAFDEDHVYCSKCGRLLQIKRIEGKVLYKLRMVSKYDGEPTVGIAKASGDLTIYDDRLEFKRTMGNAAGAMFGVVGMVIAANKAPALEVFPMSEILAVREGHYAVVMPTLVIQMNDGRTYSFCGLNDANAIHKAVAYIDEYQILN